MDFLFFEEQNKFTAQKQKKTMKNLFLLLSLVGLFISCSQGQKKIYIDNPTNKKISFEIDGKPFTMEAFTIQEVKLEDGNHTLKTPEGKKIRFEKGKEQDGAIINPTNSEYVLYTEAYTEIPFEENRMYQMKFKNVKVDEKTYYAPIELIGGYYIAHNGNNPWKYGLDEDFEETIDVQNAQKGATYNLMITKIYRKNEFAKKHADKIVNP